MVQGLLRTSDAVTPMPGLIVPLTVFTLLYVVLGAVVVALIAAMVRDTAGEPALHAREPLGALA